MEESPGLKPIRGDPRFVGLKPHANPKNKPLTFTSLFSRGSSLSATIKPCGRLLFCVSADLHYDVLCRGGSDVRYPVGCSVGDVDHVAGAGLLLFAIVFKDE